MMVTRACVIIRMPVLKWNDLNLFTWALLQNVTSTPFLLAHAPYRPKCTALRPAMHMHAAAPCPRQPSPPPQILLLPPQGGGLACLRPRDLTYVLWGFASLGHQPERLLFTIRPNWAWSVPTAAGAPRGTAALAGAGWVGGAAAVRVPTAALAPSALGGRLPVCRLNPASSSDQQGHAYRSRHAPAQLQNRGSPSHGCGVGSLGCTRERWGPLSFVSGCCCLSASLGPYPAPAAMLPTPQTHTTPHPPPQHPLTTPRPPTHAASTPPPPPHFVNGRAHRQATCVG